MIASEPQYPGGIEGFFSDISTHVEIPKKALKKGLHGSVLVRFVVQTDGYISEISILERDNELFNQSTSDVLGKL